LRNGGRGNLPDVTNLDSLISYSLRFPTLVHAAPIVSVALTLTYDRTDNFPSELLDSLYDGADQLELQDRYAAALTRVGALASDISFIQTHSDALAPTYSADEMDRVAQSLSAAHDTLRKLASLCSLSAGPGKGCIGSDSGLRFPVLHVPPRVTWVGIHWEWPVTVDQACGNIAPADTRFAISKGGWNSGGAGAGYTGNIGIRSTDLTTGTVTGNTVNGNQIHLPSNSRTCFYIDDDIAWDNFPQPNNYPYVAIIPPNIEARIW
jgi:hypothetical protein